MLKSKLCFLSQLSKEELIAAGEDPDNPGGYFVVNGSERVIVAMEDLAPNRVICDIDEKGTSPVYQSKICTTRDGCLVRRQGSHFERYQDRQLACSGKIPRSKGM